VVAASRLLQMDVPVATMLLSRVVNAVVETVVLIDATYIQYLHTNGFEGCWFRRLAVRAVMCVTPSESHLRVYYIVHEKIEQLQRLLQRTFVDD
jgi:hypothetical protein